LDFSKNSKADNLVFVGYLDNKCRIWKFDPNKSTLTKVDEMNPHLDSVKNVALHGSLGIFVTSSRVIIIFLIQINNNLIIFLFFL